jgi:hypothetical protein
MEKRGGTGRQAARASARASRRISASGPPKPDERPGLGAVDLIGILVVIAFLVLAFGALVAKHNERSGRPAWEWLERVTAPLNNWMSPSEAQETLPSAPAGAH